MIRRSALFAQLPPAIALAGSWVADRALASASVRFAVFLSLLLACNVLLRQFLPGTSDRKLDRKTADILAGIAALILALLLPPIPLLGMMLTTVVAGALFLAHRTPSNERIRRESLKKRNLYLPGFKLLAIAKALFSDKTTSTILEPIISDLQHEYLEALAECRVWKAYYVRARWYWSFWSAVAAQTPLSAVRLLSALWRALP